MVTPGNDAPPFRVLFVCTANQCRSAMCEAIARYEVTLGLAAPLQFSSAGTHASPGAPATAETRTVITELGLDLSRHRARELTRPRIQAAGLVLTMTRAHIRYVSAVVPEAADRTFTLMQFWRVAAGESADSAPALVDLARTTAEHTRKDDIVDPAGLGEDACRACAARLRLLIRPVVGALAAAAWRGGAAPTRRRRPATPMPAAGQPSATPPPAHDPDPAPASTGEPPAEDAAALSTNDTGEPSTNDTATDTAEAPDARNTGEPQAARPDAAGTPDTATPAGTVTPPRRAPMDPSTIFDTAFDTATDTGEPPAEDTAEEPAAEEPPARSGPQPTEQPTERTGARTAAPNGGRPPQAAPAANSKAPSSSRRAAASAGAAADTPAARERTNGQPHFERQPRPDPQPEQTTQPESDDATTEPAATEPEPPGRSFARLNMFGAPAPRTAAPTRRKPPEPPSDSAAGNT